MPTTLPTLRPRAALPTTEPGKKPQKARTGAARTGKPLRSRHEAFCQHFVLCGNATYAAMKAGYARKWSRNQGYRLMRQPLIRARIAAIRSTLAHAYCLDADVLLGKLEAVYQSAHEHHHFHAAARAVEIQSRIARQAARSGAAGSATGAQQDARPGRPPESEMTTNDDISRPVADGFHASSITYGPHAGQK